MQHNRKNFDIIKIWQNRYVLILYVWDADSFIITLLDNVSCISIIDQMCKGT